MPYHFFEKQQRKKDIGKKNKWKKNSHKQRCFHLSPVHLKCQQIRSLWSGKTSLSVNLHDNMISTKYQKTFVKKMLSFCRNRFFYQICKAATGESRRIFVKWHCFCMVYRIHGLQICFCQQHCLFCQFADGVRNGHIPRPLLDGFRQLSSVDAFLLGAFKITASIYIHVTTFSSHQLRLSHLGHFK